MRYLKTLNKEHQQSLASFLDTSMDYFRHYVSGYKFPSKQRIVKIIEWAKENTPDTIPTIDDFVRPEKSEQSNAK